MAKITGHSYENCRITINDYWFDGLMARHLYNVDEINPPSMMQKIRNSRNAFYRPSYIIPEAENGRVVVGLTRDVRFWAHIGTYHLPDSLVFIPLSAFRECMNKSRDEFNMPTIYSKYTWRVENYRKITRSANDYTYVTMGGYWSNERFGKLRNIKFDGGHNKLTADIIQTEFYTIPHDENGRELEREWSTCFVRDDIETLHIDIGSSY